MLHLMSVSGLSALCRAIKLPEACVRQVLSLRADPSFDRLLEEAQPLLADLLVPASWDRALAQLEALLGGDPAGMKILTCMLAVCGETKRAYEKLQIPEDIFVDTVKCFTRFIHEYTESYGTCGFDRAFWTMRQLAARLFRLGTLEFELTEEDGQKAVQIHIPSDADLSAGARRDSYRRARRFLARFFPDYCGAPFLCTSWLLAPGLRACLPEGSRILSFQDDFEVTGIFPDRDQFLTWVYKRPDIPLMDLPEDTSLQRNLKQYLLRGGKIGEAAGRLICP